MEPADGDRVFVADLSAERAGLGKANVMRFGRRPAADNAWLRGDELAVLLVAQTNGLRRNATAADARVSEGTGGRTATASSIEVRNGFSTEKFRILLPAPTAVVSLTSGRRHLDRCKLFAEGGFDRVGVGGDQRVLGGEVLVDPVRGLVRRLELVKVSRAAFRAVPRIAPDPEWSARRRTAFSLARAKRRRGWPFVWLPAAGCDLRLRVFVSRADVGG